MNWKAFSLPDGRLVRPHERHRDIGMMDGNRVAVTFNDGEVIVADENGRELYRGPLPSDRGGRLRTSKVAAAASDGGSRGTVTERFATMNTFIDDVARYLEDTEKASWHVLYRHADAATSTAEVSIATVAEKVGRSERSVIRAIEHLTKCGLIERLHRGRRRTGPSRYRIATRPANQLERVRELAEARSATRSPRVQRDTHVTLNGANRDHYGRYST